MGTSHLPDSLEKALLMYPGGMYVSWRDDIPYKVKDTEQIDLGPTWTHEHKLAVMLAAHTPNIIDRKDVEGRQLRDQWDHTRKGILHIKSAWERKTRSCMYVRGNAFGLDRMFVELNKTLDPGKPLDRDNVKQFWSYWDKHFQFANVNKRPYDPHEGPTHPPKRPRVESTGDYSIVITICVVAIVAFVLYKYS